MRTFQLIKPKTLKQTLQAFIQQSFEVTIVLKEGETYKESSKFEKIFQKMFLGNERKSLDCSKMGSGENES